MPINSRLGKKMELEIERLGINGEGVSSWYGCTIFVDGALPEEKVLASLYEKKKNYGRARVLSLLSTSPDRVEPICPLFGRCGGCQMMHMSYDRQLMAKRQRVVDALERIGKFKEVSVSQCRPSFSELFYRNKIQIPVEAGESGMRLGLYAKNSHDLIDMQTCYIHCPLGQKVYEALKPLLQASSIIPFNKRTGQGEIRHVLIKTAVATNQVLIVLVGAQKPTSEMLEFARLLIERIPEVKGVVHCLNTDVDNTVLSQSFTVLQGQGAIEEKLLGLYFKISPASFFQVNPRQAEALYQAAIDVSAVDKEDVVLDAYCGVGTMSLLFAQRAKRVIGIESVEDAIVDAKANASRNNIGNAEFHAATVEGFIRDFSDKVDVIILNPPRKGCDPSVIDSIACRDLKKIVYVSCDPATLARDLHLLAQKGWVIDTVEPFDMFPQTAHVETLVSLKAAR